MNGYHYDQPPPGFTPFHGDSSPTSPHDQDYVYYAPQYTHATSPSHRRSRSHNYNQTAPPHKIGGWHTPAGYPAASFYEKHPNNYHPPEQQAYHVSTAYGAKSKLRRFSESGGKHHNKPTRSQKQPVFVDVVEDAYDPPQYNYRKSNDFNVRSKHEGQYTDEFLYVHQNEFSYDDSPKRSRARRSSTANRPSSKSYKSIPVKIPRAATEKDAEREGIPAGYSIKNWDPSEAPIILLGSVFDANTIGKWIYDWTVYHLGGSSPMALMAGDIWLLLLRMAGATKRAQFGASRVHGEDREILLDFVDSGHRQWENFKTILKRCERYMWQASKRDGSKNVKMGKEAGTEFVDTFFGIDRELPRTEKLMASIATWEKRFIANCEEILDSIRRQ